MSLKLVLEKLKRLEATNSVNDKVSLLKEFLTNPTFRKVVQFALNQSQTYNVNKILFIPGHNKTNIDDIFSHLTYMHEKGGASNEDKNKLNILASIDEETVEVVNRIVLKDLRCGVSHKTLSKVGKNIVEQVPYQRCSGESAIKNVMYPAVVQKKADSMFAYAMPWRNPDIFCTRNGNYFHIFGNLKEELMEIMGNAKYVFVGELQVLDPSLENVLSRKTGNGYLSSFLQGTGDVDIAKRVIYDVWDIIPFEHYENRLCPMAYQSRFLMLVDMLDGWAKKNLSKNIPPINVIPYEIVNSEKEARDFYKKMRDSGFEGAILKDFSEKWKPTTSNKFIKLKNRTEAEFEIVDAYYGTEGKRNSNILGGLTVKSSDGKIVTNVGTGFTEEDRKHGVDWWKSHIGDIVTLSFESVISEKTGRKTFKLFLPAFEDTRFTEKIEADTLEYCQSLGYQ